MICNDSPHLFLWLSIYKQHRIHEHDYTRHGLHPSLDSLSSSPLRSVFRVPGLVDFAQRPLRRS
jgi:hypothetical protein